MARLRDHESELGDQQLFGGTGEEGHNGRGKGGHGVTGGHF